ncbi:MAG: hypothetical protein CVU77_06075 [Elusimicrobia bacterium HGW-Elusimicrobia-1]|nr:MAG: hypothetical protein CVU77_06075 [Elusimicrobia bacterium HGW-Elusimicrobia-1]
MAQLLIQVNIPFILSLQTEHSHQILLWLLNIWWLVAEEEVLETMAEEEAEGEFCLVQQM